MVKGLASSQQGTQILFILSLTYTPPPHRILFLLLVVLTLCHTFLSFNDPENEAL